MPGKVKVKIISGRNLPVMDRSSDTTDAYVEIKLGSTTYKTDVCRKSLHPQWNTEWYRFEVDDSELQDEPLQIRLMDHDTYSANDAIGKVYLNLNPLLLPAASHLTNWNGDSRTRDNASSNTTMMSGWLPVYDTMHGIRGEVDISVKVEHFSDFNKFRQSSCGIQFFCSPAVPHGFYAHTVHGFVEELIVNDDPEYQWIDKIRTPRASNEARQTLFCKLAGELQRKIGVKALDLGGNSVIGYRQSFDLEGESGIVARGIGTAVTLVKIAQAHGIPGSTAEELNGDERATLSYMRFLGSTKGFFLNNPITNNSSNKYRGVLSSVPPFLSPPPLIVAPLAIPSHHHKPSHSHPHHHHKSNSNKPLAQITRHLSDKEMNQAKPSPDSLHHGHSLQTLLKQEDMRGRPHNSTYRISNRFWKFKQASHSKLSKRITHLKAKLADIDSCSDIKYMRSHSDSSGMAEILVRSVIHAANSLDCIAEAPTPSSSPALVVVPSTSADDQDQDHASPDLPRDESGSYLSLPSTSIGSCSSKTSESSLDDDDDDDDDEDEDDDDDDSKGGSLEDIGEVVKNARKLSMAPLDSPLIEERKTRNENTRNMFYLEIEQDIIDDVDNSDTVSEPLNFSPGKPEITVQDSIVDSDTEEETIASGETVLGVPFTNIFRLQETNSLTVEKNQFYRRSISHNMDKCHIVEIPAIKKRHRSHETVLGIPFTNIFQSNSDAPHQVNGHDSAVLHIEREIEVSESLPVTKSMNKSATFICLHDLAPKTNDSPKGKPHHKSHETLQTIPFTSIFQSHEHVTVQFPKSIQEGTTLNFTCDRTVTRDRLVKSSTSTSLSDYFSNKNQTPRIWNKSLDIVFDEGSDRIIITKTSSPIESEIPSSSNKPKSISKLVSFAKKTKDTVVSKLKRSGSTIRDKNGLLNTALGNVLMESVNEMLVTSSHESPVVVQTSNKDKPLIPKESPPTKKSALHKVRSFFRRKSGSKSAMNLDEVKPGGLLQCALDNVLMETANEMLATSQPVKQPTNPFVFPTNPTNPSQSIITTNNRLDGDQPPAPTEAAQTSPTPSPPSVTKASISVPVSQPQPIAPTQTQTHQRSESMGASSGNTRVVPPPPQAHSPTKLNSIHRRSSDSDLSITSKGNSLSGSDRSGGYSSGHYMRANNALIRSTVPQENFDILEYPFLTMSQYPPGFIAFLGGAVNSRSVKLLERITNLEEPESRDIWWSEIRMEIRSHARALNCNAVLGYKETTSICEEVCVLSASGTAAIIGYQCGDTISTNDTCLIPNMDNMTSSLDRNDFEKERLLSQAKTGEFPVPNTPQVRATSESPEKDKDIVHPLLATVPTAQVASQGCSICHLPYKAKVAQLRNTTSKCSVCRLRKVPDVLIATIELPEGIPTQGRGCFLQSYVCRPLKDLKGESNAKEISDGLPFLEYELHRLLLNKLKVKGMNAIFGLNVRISIGERMLIGIATGTAVFLAPLPVPPVPKLRSTDEDKLAKLQRQLHETVKKNREIYQLFNDQDNNRILSDDDSEDDRPAMELNSGNKDCCVLEVDDPEDVTELNLLMEPRPPDGFHVVNTERVPGGLEDLEIVKNLQMFTQVWRSRVQPPYNFDRHFHRLLQTVYFKLRRMVPCALCHLQFRVESPEPDEIQLCVLGMALGLGDPEKNSKLKRKNFHQKRNDDELIFNIEDDLIPENSVTVNTNYLYSAQNLKHRQKSPVRNKFAAKQQHHLPYKERHGVDITPLSYVPGGKIEKYLGNLNFFFIRETNSIREEGGLSGFMHTFITEVLAIVRSHVTALGGNAMVAYYLTECTLNHNLHKNQGQCLINVGGDVVFVSYYADDH